jgi:hypothetical protein
MTLKFLLEGIAIGLRNPKRIARYFKAHLLHPKNPAAKLIAAIVVSRKNRLDFIAANKHGLLMCYDLALCPDTFDFAEYIAQAEIIRRNNGLEYIDVLLVHYGKGAIIPEADVFSDYFLDSQRVFKVHEVLFGICRLLPSVRNIFFVNRDNAVPIVQTYSNLYPDDYHPYRGRRPSFFIPESPEAFFPMFQAPENARKLIREYLERFQGKKIITITLREHPYVPSRNSNIEEWVRFARALGDDYLPIFIPDAYTYSSPFRDKIREFEVLDTACWNLPIRAAVYEAAWMNLAMVSGPILISLYSEKANTLFFYNVEAYPKDFWEHIQEVYGDEVNEKRPYLRYNNHYVYKADTFENIVAEFEKLSSQIALQGG